MQETEVDVRQEIKRAILLGDLHKAETLVLQSGGMLSRVEQVQILEAIERAKWGKTQPMNNPELCAVALKL